MKSKIFERVEGNSFRLITENRELDRSNQQLAVLKQKQAEGFELWKEGKIQLFGDTYPMEILKSKNYIKSFDDHIVIVHNIHQGSEIIFPSGVVLSVYDLKKRDRLPYNDVRW